MKPSKKSAKKLAARQAQWAGRKGTRRPGSQNLKKG